MLRLDWVLAKECGARKVGPSGQTDTLPWLVHPAWRAISLTCQRTRAGDDRRSIHFFICALADVQISLQLDREYRNSATAFSGEKVGRQAHSLRQQPLIWRVLVPLPRWGQRNAVGTDTARSWPPMLGAEKTARMQCVRPPPSSRAGGQ